LASAAAALAEVGMRVIRISNPDGSPVGLRELAAQVLARPIERSSPQLIAAALADLTGLTGEGEIVLIVDDAHTLSDPAMELLLVITSSPCGVTVPPQLVLSGRGTFWERHWREELQPIVVGAKKISVEPLTAEDARDFVMITLGHSGGTITDVTPEALTALVRCSSGMPAQMERICAAALALGNGRGASLLTTEIVDTTVLSSTLESLLSSVSEVSGSDRTATWPMAEALDAASDSGAVPGRPVPTTAGAAAVCGSSAASGPPALATGRLPRVADRTSRPGWRAIATAVLILLTGASAGLVAGLRTHVTSWSDQNSPEATPPPMSEDMALAPKSRSKNAMEQVPPPDSSNSAASNRSGRLAAAMPGPIPWGAWQ
jgi:type II secretory pathway predicted ATPase ExeA